MFLFRLKNTYCWQDSLLWQWYLRKKIIICLIFLTTNLWICAGHSFIRIGACSNHDLTYVTAFTLIFFCSTYLSALGSTSLFHLEVELCCWVLFSEKYTITRVPFCTILGIIVHLLMLVSSALFFKWWPVSEMCLLTCYVLTFYVFVRRINSLFISIYACLSFYWGKLDRINIVSLF